MRNEKRLINLFTRLVKLLNDESDRNPAFASELDALLAPIANTSVGRKRHKVETDVQNLPDIYREFSNRGRSEFSLWLRELPIQTLRKLIRHHDFDAQRRTAKWKEQEKLIEFIIEKIQSRIERGSAFLTIHKINEDPG
jgi:hypothetical protein